jgi:GWxTD domain-containing protein
MLLNTSLLGQEVKQSNLYLYEIEQNPDVPFFNVNLFNVAADSVNLSRLIIRLSFVNDELQFITTKDKRFRADYEVFVVIFDTLGSEIKSKKAAGYVMAQNFDETNSKKLLNSAQVEVDLQPNKYQFRISLKDVETQRIGVRKGWVVMQDFSKGELMLSDILFLDSLTLNKDQRLKQLMNDLDRPLDATKHYVYYEVYNTSEPDSVQIIYEILGPKNDIIKEGEHWIQSRGRITPDFIELDEDKSLAGSYRLKIEIKSKDGTLQAEKPIYCDCKPSLPPYADMKDAIEKLMYIAKNKELKLLKKAQGEEQIEEFKKFWQRRDPTPETPENEYMEEYYNRINTANEIFLGNRKGWKTDMGFVYVMLGPPDYIDKPVLYNEFYDPTLRRRPNVVWHYIGLRRQILFYFSAGEYRIGNLKDVSDILYGEMLF